MLFRSVAQSGSRLPALTINDWPDFEDRGVYYDVCRGRVPKLERLFELADQLAFRAAAARASLELSFYDPLEGRYAHGRRADGSLNLAETAMTAVPLLLGAVQTERCEKWLDRIASPDFTTPWGVRLIPPSDPDYQPDGYHTGSVWPLYTGWTCLAEAAAGRAGARGAAAMGAVVAGGRHRTGPGCSDVPEPLPAPAGG